MCLSSSSVGGHWLWLSYSLVVLMQMQVCAYVRYNIREEYADIVRQRQSQVEQVADSCVENLGTSLGTDFLKCVFSEMEAAYASDSSLFPVPDHTFGPLTIHKKTQSVDPVQHATLLGDLLRNYTCNRDDGSSPMLSQQTWEWNPNQAMQETCADPSSSGQWTLMRGYLPQGDEITSAQLPDEASAKQLCRSLEECAGFTYKVVDGQPLFYFKSRASRSRVSRNDEWRTEIQHRSQCHLIGNMTVPTRSYEVKILRHEPLVAVVPNFASPEECADLINYGGSENEMARAFEAGGQSQYRRSYSSNIDVDYDDTLSPLTSFSNRQFAFTRDLTGYNVSGPGQEPINAVLYKDTGDEYRPHCDGPCHGGLYQSGQRVATSILYCQVAEKGGGTSFMRSGMMVLPEPGDLLLFAYKYANGSVDNGFTQHSGCPIRHGRKWIATQWFREGVDYDQTWQVFA